jgi:hypothetical protein
VPWAKGQSGNPGGRPKALAEWRKSDEAKGLRDLAYDVLEAACSEGNAVEWRDRISAAKELLDRIEGKPAQALTGGDGGPLQVGVIVLPPEELD